MSFESTPQTRAMRKRALRALESDSESKARHQLNAERNRRYRANADEAVRESRQAQNRDSHRLRRQVESDGERELRLEQCRLRMKQLRPTTDRVRESMRSQNEPLSNTTFNFVIASEERKEQIEKELIKALGAPGLDECTCAVCDRLVLRKQAKMVMSTDVQYLAKMNTMLQQPADFNIPQSLLEQYNCSDMCDILSHAMLSKRGITTMDDDFIILVCLECDHDLCDKKFIDSKAPPKFAIANHFFVGSLPDSLSDVSWMETMMTQLVTVVAQTRVMRGGAHRSIRSHSILFDATPGPPAVLLPRHLEDDCIYRVILAGSMTMQQEQRIRKLHIIRHSKVMELLDFYKKNNPLYQDVQVCRDASYNSDVDKIFVRQINAPESVVDDIDLQGESLSGRSDSTVVFSLQDECTMIERNVLFVPENAAPASESISHLLSELKAPEHRHSSLFEVYHSSLFAVGSGDIEAKMFAHLFPFGRGHPGEERRTKVSKIDCIRYYSMLSSRNFAQDKTFMMICFDRLSLENMYKKTYFTSVRMPGVFKSFEDLTSDELQAALLQNETFARGMHPRREQGDSLTTSSRFLKSVQIGSMAVWGSNSEREACRRRAFGYQARFGQPALFVTINPNTDNSFVTAYYAGNATINTLFDSDLAELPTRMRMKEIAMSDDVAAARLFVRTIDCFIDHVLGYNTKTKSSKPDGGLFGNIQAYFGMVETQGRGTLHSHFLLWLQDTPSNSVEFSEAMQDPDMGGSFSERVLQLADSVVSNEFPIEIGTFNCTRCGSTGTEVKGLPIPSSSRMNIVQRVKQRSDKISCVKEPLLLSCQSCAQQFSTQHRIRQALLKFRPPYWPHYDKKLTSLELKEQVCLEKHLHSTLTDTEQHILARENLCGIESEEMMTNESSSTYLDFLEGYNTTQNAYTSAEDNPLHGDDNCRRIEMLPPTLNYLRLTENAKKYMQGVLVATVNMHWWSHTGSCFKQNRRSGSNQICRYMFPRERVPRTSFRKSCIVNKRSIGNEYINGYNSTILATFKCNHDIQLLLGGRDATNRIYYACKYITKPQHHADSKAALALASFHRRQAREKQEQNTPSTTARKRVTSMVYTMTNKQEIAGPLASFYIMQGSCAFESHSHVTISLQSILHQVQESGKYSCLLVPAFGNESSDTEPSESSRCYKKVSQLDDYIFRPRGMDNCSLYEYSMRYFSRTRTETTQTNVLYLEVHPSFHTRCVGIHRKEVVPVVTGPRLPFYDSIDPTDQKLLSKHATIALVLFKPFRTILDLVQQHHPERQNWIDAYELWKPNRSPLVIRIMNNMYDYHVGREISEDCFNQEPMGLDYGVDGDGEDDAYHSIDVQDSSQISVDSQTKQNDDYESERHKHAFLEISCLNGIPDTDNIDPAIFPGSRRLHQNVEDIVERMEDRELMEQMAIGATETYTSSTSQVQDIGPDQCNQLRYQRFQDTKSLRKWLKTTNQDSTLLEEREGLFAETETSMLQHLQTRLVEILSGSHPLNGMSTWNTGTYAIGEGQNVNLNRFADLNQVACSYSLNARQYASFMIIGRKMMARWLFKLQYHTSPSVLRDSLNAVDHNIENNQVLFYLGGEGGTGKSRVIDAIEALTLSWDQRATLLKTAMTGKAATIISGRTLDGFLKQCENKSTSVFLYIETIIIDEVSMMGKADLVKLECACRKLRPGVNLPFGGINIILAGDFLQLPPVRRDPLYINPENKTQPAVMDTDGFKLWRSFGDVVMLNENMRFKNDPEWGEGCRLARKGQWADWFINIINSRLLFAGAQDLSSEPGMIEDYNKLMYTLKCGKTRFVTPDNITRAAINDTFIVAAAKKLPQGHYPIRVRANFHGNLNGLSDADIQTIMSYPDSTLGRMAPYLDLIPGMPVQITQNICPQKGIANGSTGTLQHVMFPPDTQFNLVRDSRLGIEVRVPNKRPSCATVKLDHFPQDISPMPESYQHPNLIPLFHDAKAYTSSTAKLTPSRTGEPRSVLLRPEQFPFVCAAGSTVYKVQGETLTSMVIVNWRAKAAIVNKPQQAYLMLSRVVSRESLLIMEEFTPSIQNFSKPPAQALHEEERLVQLSNSTLSKFDANFYCNLE